MIKITHKDNSVREFSKEVHGEKFAEVAKEYGETNKARIVSIDGLEEEKETKVKVKKVK